MERFPGLEQENIIQELQEALALLQAEVIALASLNSAALTLTTSGTFDAGQVFVTALDRTLTYQADGVGSVATCLIAPTAEAVFTLRADGVAFGTVTFAAASNIGIFAGDETTFVAGNEIEWVCPDPADLTLEGVGITLQLLRGGDPADSNAEVTSVFGRTGDVVEVKSDYMRESRTSLGTKSSGTLTLNTDNGRYQIVTNGGAFALAPPSLASTIGTTINLLVTNNATAGVIDVTAWTKVTGAFDTTDGHKFMCRARVIGTTSLLEIVNLF
jgi:hypothetical protein